MAVVAAVRAAFLTVLVSVAFQGCASPGIKETVDHLNESLNGCESEFGRLERSSADLKAFDKFFRGCVMDLELKVTALGTGADVDFEAANVPELARRLRKAQVMEVVTEARIFLLFVLDRDSVPTRLFGSHKVLSTDNVDASKKMQHLNEAISKVSEFALKFAHDIQQTAH